MNRTDALIKGLQILNKYPGCYTAAEHDIIYSGPIDHKDVSDEDAKELDDLGWFVDNQSNVWGIFI